MITSISLIVSILYKLQILYKYMYWTCGWLINNLLSSYWYMNYMSSEEPLKTVINSYLLGILEVQAPTNQLVIVVMDYCLVINPLLARKPLSHREVRCLHGHSEKYHVYCFNNIHKIFILPYTNQHVSGHVARFWFFQFIIAFQDWKWAFLLWHWTSKIMHQVYWFLFIVATPWVKSVK